MRSLQVRYGPWALVTGASSGKGSARQLAHERFNLVLVARREERLHDLARDLERKASIEARVVRADLSQDDFLPPLVAATKGSRQAS